MCLEIRLFPASDDSFLHPWTRYGWLFSILWGTRAVTDAYSYRCW
jgi:hypothetical protein